IRNGRFVIPIRTEQKRGIDGIIHGTSSSGATVFMEPLAVLEMNNELVRLQEEERYETARILAELTDLIQASLGQIEFARSLSAYIEVVFAKARFGRDFNCVRPSLSRGALLSLIKARHPLLEDNLRRENGQTAPISLDMDSSRQILVISGPNAGGKTVVLKTIGLLALMAQSGIPVPAEESALPIFDRVLADIGDQQSITNHLSTFSAHVLAIKSMLESATARSLILLDEIGGSTEPGEGAALARAVLEQFREIGALTVATTHYNRLKLYAETTSGVANAAMEFVLAKAAGLLGMADAEAAHYVEELRRRVSDLEGEKVRLENQRRDFEVWKQKELEQIRTQHKDEIARVETKLERIVRDMSDRASKELESVRDDSVKKYQKKLANVKAQATREIGREKEKIQPIIRPEPAPSVPPINAGQVVRVVSLAVTGTVISMRADEAEVLVGSIKLRRPLADLEVIQKAAMRLPPGVHLSVLSKQLDKNEINLVGRRVDEAVDMVDKFLDDAFLAQINPIRIVHGTGTGALRHAIAELLSGHPHVDRFEDAPHSEGGRGVTVVRLRE
ncbi:MAG: hypothetical protein DMG12_17095, partial [Acidobacteria bacterium]